MLKKLSSARACFSYGISAKMPSYIDEVQIYQTWGRAARPLASLRCNCAPATTMGYFIIDMVHSPRTKSKYYS